MTTDPLKLTALTLTAVQAATDRYARTGNLAAWETTMRAALTRGHTAAYVAGTAERLHVGLGTLKGLSRIERAAVRAALDRQFGYLDGFAAVVRRGELTPAQIAARAELYAGGVRGTYYQSRWGDWELPWVPGDGSTPCGGRCRCRASVVDNGDGSGIYTWALGGERHCDACPARAGDHPVKRKAT